MSSVYLNKVQQNTKNPIIIPKNIIKAHIKAIKLCNHVPLGIKQLITISTINTCTNGHETNAIISANFNILLTFFNF